MNHFKNAVLFMMFFALTLVLISCAQPPEAEKSAAKAAMDAAVAAGAEMYAPAEFDAAKILWNTSEVMMNEKKYEGAKQIYINAKAAFEKAASTAVASKKTMTDEVTAIVAALEEEWKDLETSAKNVEKKIKDKKDAWDADTKAFEEGMKTVKGMIAADPAVAKMKTGELMAIIDKWDTTFKELAATPEKSAKKKKKKKK